MDRLEAYLSRPSHEEARHSYLLELFGILTELSSREQFSQKCTSIIDGLTYGTSFPKLSLS